MIILGLDISSSSTGWAVIKNGRFYKRDGIDYGLIKGPVKMGPAEKISNFRVKLKEVMLSVLPDYVLIEDTFFSRNPKTLKVLSRYAGVALELSWSSLNAEPMLVLPTALRTVWGTQDKKEIFELVIKKYKLKDWEFKKHNDLTDAIAIAWYGHKRLK